MPLTLSPYTNVGLDLLQKRRSLIGNRKYEKREYHWVAENNLKGSLSTKEGATGY